MARSKAATAGAEERAATIPMKERTKPRRDVQREKSRKERAKSGADTAARKVRRLMRQKASRKIALTSGARMLIPAEAVSSK